MRTDFLVSSKKILALSGMPSSFWVAVPAPLIPEVAFVEFPPINLKRNECYQAAMGGKQRTSSCPIRAHFRLVLERENER